MSTSKIVNKKIIDFINDTFGKDLDNLEKSELLFKEFTKTKHDLQKKVRFMLAISFLWSIIGSFLQLLLVLLQIIISPSC